MRELSQRYGILPHRVKGMVWMQQLYLEDILPKMPVEMIKLSNDMDKILTGRTVIQDYGMDLEEMERQMLGEEKIFFPNHLIPDNPKIHREQYTSSRMLDRSETPPLEAEFEDSVFGKKGRNYVPKQVISEEKMYEYHQRKDHLKHKTKQIGDAYNKYLRLHHQMEVEPQWELKERGKKQDLVVERIMGHGRGKIRLKNWMVNNGAGKMRVTKMFRRCVHESHQENSLPKEVRGRAGWKGPRLGGVGHGVVH